MLLYILVIGI